MSSRNTLKYTTSVSTPGTAQDGDEYYNPTTGKLYKNVVVNGTTLTFVEIPVANKPVNITDTTPSYNTSTGALTVAGGLGVGGDINFGGNLYQNGVLFTGGGGSSTGTTSTFTISNTATSTSTTTGALTVTGGVGIGGNINFGGNLYQNGVLFTGGGGGGGYVTLTMPGTITPPFSGTARFYPPAAISISMVYANLGSNPSSGNLNFVIKKNGVSIGATCTLATALMTPVSVSVSLTTSDYLTLDVSGSNASDLNVKLRYTYT